MCCKFVFPIKDFFFQDNNMFVLAALLIVSGNLFNGILSIHKIKLVIVSYSAGCHDKEISVYLQAFIYQSRSYYSNLDCLCINLSESKFSPYNDTVQR